jgi:hypothetical protein
VRAPHRVDCGSAQTLLARWLPDPAARRKLLLDTPALVPMPGYPENNGIGLT